MSCLFYLTIFVVIFQPEGCYGGAVEEISLIKNLLTNIFNRYKTDMASLQEVVELTTGDLNRWGKY
jgi:hypothetical protein